MIFLLTEYGVHDTTLRGSGDFTMTFGQALSCARKKRGMQQRELAAKVLKDDGTPMSPQYLNDIEHDKRGAPDDAMITRIARAVRVAPELLYFCAGRLPPQIARMTPACEGTVVAAFRAMRDRLR